jgi:hypothetical protein
MRKIMLCSKSLGVHVYAMLALYLGYAIMKVCFNLAGIVTSHKSAHGSEMNTDLDGVAYVQNPPSLSRIT